MYKTCSKCGKIHPYSFKCTRSREYNGGLERDLRKRNAWKRKSIEIRERAFNLCEVCKTKGIYTYEGLEVHHIHKLKDNPDGLLDDLNLVCLCTECHKKADQGDISIDYLENLARVREQE